MDLVDHAQTDHDDEIMRHERMILFEEFTDVDHVNADHSQPLQSHSEFSVNAHTNTLWLEDSLKSYEGENPV